jgi:hypothetical protein
LEILKDQRFAFAGVGGAPKADDRIVMTQVRYYPFQHASPAGNGRAVAIAPRWRCPVHAARAGSASK